MAQDFLKIYRAALDRRGLTEDPAQVAVCGEFTRIAEALHDRPVRRGWFGRAEPRAATGLYLWGGVGRGKSMMMDLFFEHLDIEGKRRVHFHAFMQDVHAAIGHAREGGTDDAIRPVAEEIGAGLRLLCFDEMQIGDITDAMIVGRLFEGLFDAGVTVVATSNRRPDALYKDGLQRERFVPFIELMKQRMAVVELAAGRDWRGERIGDAALYLVPADAAARDAMDALWDRLTDGLDEKRVLRVAGHDMEIPHFSDGIARATFWELCARPLGAADYLALAKAARMLLLEDVPRLSSENYNEARRFVTLVDALYEGRVRLAVSAADVPERLYIEGTGSFEFERTASRLHEMQTADWGG